MQVHEEYFVARFSSGTLSEMEMRRIGFGEVTRHPDLIERTKAEVAGTARLSIMWLLIPSNHGPHVPKLQASAYALLAPI